VHAVLYDGRKKVVYRKEGHPEVRIFLSPGPQENRR
jgi:hypothetical protein